MLNIIAKLLKILNSEESPQAVAWAVALAFAFSMLPTFSLAKWLVLVVVAFFRVNLSAFIAFSVVFPLLAWLLDPLFNQLGLWLLKHPQLESFWSGVVTSSIGESLALNNTLGLASLLIALTLMLPLVWGVKKLVVLYREELKAKLEKLYIVKVIKASKLYQVYQSIA